MKKNLVNLNNLHEIDKAHGLSSKLWEKAKTIVANDSVNSKVATLRAKLGSSSDNSQGLKKAKM